MRLLDDILGQVSESTTVQNLAAKVGLTPDEVETATNALAQAHGQSGDAVQRASAASGISADKLNEIFTTSAAKGRSAGSLRSWRTKGTFRLPLEEFRS